MTEHDPRTECVREFADLKGRLTPLEHGATAMAEDIKSINTKLANIEIKVAQIPGEVKGMLYDGLKWVLGTYLVGAMVCFFIVGGMKNQLDVNTKKWDSHEYEVQHKEVTVK